MRAALLLDRGTEQRSLEHEMYIMLNLIYVSLF